MVEIKICGLTRPEDAELAARAGARYVGVVFAGGPRMLDPARARAVLDGAGGGVARVGVMGKQSAWEIAGIVAETELDIVQLHGDPDPRDVANVRRATERDVWAVLRIRDGVLPVSYAELVESADAVVLDAYSSEQLGGTGVALGWPSIARALEDLPRPRRLVLAGGLRSDNVSTALDALHPDVLDVSSGVERGIGEKDPERVHAFVNAARRSAP